MIWNRAVMHGEVGQQSLDFVTPDVYCTLLRLFPTQRNPEIVGDGWLLYLPSHSRAVISQTFSSIPFQRILELHKFAHNRHEILVPSYDHMIKVDQEEIPPKNDIGNEKPVLTRWRRCRQLLVCRACREFRNCHRFSFHPYTTPILCVAARFSPAIVHERQTVIKIFIWIL